MSQANDTSVVFDAALALPFETRSQLLRELLISLESDEPSIADYKRLMREELERRWPDLIGCELITIDWKKLMSEIRHQLITRKTA